MEKIFAKFVKERKREFQIETALWKDGNQICITKRNLYPEGEKHIRQMYDTFLMYQDQNILCPSALKDTVITFEYMDGDTMEARLLHAVQKGKKDIVEAIAAQYETVVNAVCRESEKEAIEKNNRIGYKNMVFDLTFDNLIDRDGYKIIDYEWRFETPVEKEFVKFRAVYAFIMKYGTVLASLYPQVSDFYQVFGIQAESIERYQEYNEAFIRFVYGEESYQKILQPYKKQTTDLCNPKIMAAMKQAAALDENKKESYEDKIYRELLETVEKHQYLYDDYQKFFRVTDKLKATVPYGYLTSKEFSEEFQAYLYGCYDMIEFYLKQSEEKQKIVDELNVMFTDKQRENEAQAKKYSEDYEILTSEIRRLQEKLDYIQSSKIYRSLLQKKVEERFK